MIGGKTPPAESNSQGTFPLKMYNLKTRRRCFYFPHTRPVRVIPLNAADAPQSPNAQ